MAARAALQVAYAGHLLYTYALERRPGEALGNGIASFGGRWQASDSWAFRSLASGLGSPVP